MKIDIAKAWATKIKCDLLVINYFEGVKELSGAAKAVDQALRGLIKKLIRSGELRGKRGRFVSIHTYDRIPAKKVLIVGLGEREKFDLDVVRHVSAVAIKVAKADRCRHVASVVHGGGMGGLKIEDAAQALIEGTILGSYKFSGYAQEKEKEFKVEKFTVIESDKNKIKGLQKGMKIGEILSWSQNRVRDLVNAPANFAAPHHLAKYARNTAKKTKKLKCVVYDPRKLGMHALWSVAKGSEEPPRLVVLKYKGSPKAKVTALIGKGVTFDSGGISLKPSRKLWEMKIDMAGAAAVMEIMRAAAELKLKKNLLAVIPLTENMPSGRALKPGDVVSSLSGKKIEVISTDAEGRMILADAITYARRMGAAKIIDMATLTGGCITALGDVASAYMGNDEEMLEKIKLSSLRSGEKFWQLPLYEEYNEYLKSKLADFKNCTEGRGASPSIGGIFLLKFVGKTPWVHLDIAGTAYLSKARNYLQEGATGIPLRTVLEWLMLK